MLAVALQADDRSSPESPGLGTPSPSHIFLHNLWIDVWTEL